MSRSCPKCGVVLASEIHEGVTVDVCPVCAGIWFDEGELSALMEKGVTTLVHLEERYLPNVEKDSAPVAGVRCPACGSLLYRYRYMYNTPIELEGCEKCDGIWVDDEELRKMVQVLEQQKDQPVPPEVELEVAMIQAEAEHKETMGRHQWLHRLFGLVSARPFRYWP